MGRRRQDIQVAVVTGASAGVGRATVGSSPGAATPSRCSPAAGRARRRRRGRPRGRRRAALPIEVDMADHDAVVARRRADRDGARPDRRVGQRARSPRSSRRSADISPEEFRRVTEVTYLGYVYGTRAALRHMLPARPRHHRPGRLRAGLPRASRCSPPTAAPSTPSRASHESLRCELLHEHSNVQRDHGAAAGGEHPAVRLGAVPAAPARRSRYRRSTSPRWPPAAIVVRRRAPAPPRILGRRLHRRDHARQRASRRGCWTATWPGPASSSQQTGAAAPTTTGRTTCGSPPTARRARLRRAGRLLLPGAQPQPTGLALPTPDGGGRRRARTAACVLAWRRS